MTTAGDVIRDRDATPGEPRSLAHYRRTHPAPEPYAIMPLVHTGALDGGGAQTHPAPAEPYPCMPRVPPLDEAAELREERERIWRAVRNIARGD